MVDVPEPGHTVWLEVGFANDDRLKANAALTFKAKGVSKFKTV